MNIKNSLLLLDPQFDPNTAPECNLLIKITNDSFSYAIINQESRRLKAIFDEQECADISHTLNTKLKNDPYLKYPFKDVKVSLTASDSVAVPNELYQEKHIPFYLNFMSAGEPDRIHVKQNPHFNFTSVFGLQPALENSLNSAFDQPVKFDLSSPVLTLAAGVNKGLVLDFTALSFTAVYVNEGQLVLKNTYEVENAEEFNYYLLLILKQLNTEDSQIPVYLSGIINEGDSRHKVIQKYFRNIEFKLPQNPSVDCKILDDMPAYYYSSLLAIDLCG